MDSVLQLLDELEDVMDSSKAVPFSNKVSVDKEEIYDIISEIRMKLPNELKQSKWVIEERNKILIDAQREADERNAPGRHGIRRKRTGRCRRQAERTESSCLQRKHQDRRLLWSDTECTGRKHSGTAHGQIISLCGG